MTDLEQQWSAERDRAATVMAPTGPTRHPWPEQSAQPGHVHVLRCERPDMAFKAAEQWGRRNGFRVERRIFGDVLLVRWSPRG